MMWVKWLLALGIAVMIGKAVSKVKLPAILGWLIAGMLLGPFGIGLIDEALLENHTYEMLIHIGECIVGIMIGTELIVEKFKSYGKALVVTTLWQSLGAYFLVAFLFGLLFSFRGEAIYLAFIFGGIALATAPAPALSIVREYKTKGPVTQTLIPMAALDDMVGAAMFFTTISVVMMIVSGGSLSISVVPLMIFLPLIIGGVVGLPIGGMMKKREQGNSLVALTLVGVLITTGLGVWVNGKLPAPVLNYMLMGMAFSAVFSNRISQEKTEKTVEYFSPILTVALVIVIVELGVPLDLRAMKGAGLYTLLYMVGRGLGKYFGARIGARISGMPETVQKYLGLTLLPHSGVSLVFAGIAASALTSYSPEGAVIIQGTIAAAAIINEIIAVILAKKGFEAAGEIPGVPEKS